MKRTLLLAAALLFAAVSAKAQLNVYFIDVGQGDAIYIEFPNGTNALVDGGPNGEMVARFLKSKNVTKIDRVVLTHPHSDHYRGLKKVFNSFDVKSYYDTRAENRDAAGDNNLRDLAAAEPGCRTYYPKPGDNLDWDNNVTVKVFNACWQPVIMHENSENNNCSLVMRLYYGGHGVMLTGDAEEEIERDIMSHFKSGLQSTFLKVAHHGSRGANTMDFLNRVRPKYSFISVGRDNVYGHPHKEAIDRLRAVGSEIYMTLGLTQWFTIPKPVKGAELAEGEFRIGVYEAQEPRFDPLTSLSADPFAEAARNSALGQLQQEAGAR